MALLRPWPGSWVLVVRGRGASIALVVAAKRPDPIRALVVAEPPFHGLRYATRSFLGMVARAKLSQLRGRSQDAAAIFFRWVTAYQSGGNAFDRLPAELRQLMLDNARPVVAESDAHPTGVLFEHVPMRALIGIPAPITFLLAESSQPWFHRIHARLLRAMPGIQTERIPGAGHYINSDAPAEFLAAVERGATRAARDRPPADGGR